MSAATRREHDLLGDIDVPAAAYYGAHTARALENFPISGTTIAAQPHLVAALATVKQAAATANHWVSTPRRRLRACSASSLESNQATRRPETRTASPDRMKALLLRLSNGFDSDRCMPVGTSTLCPASRARPRP